MYDDHKKKWLLFLNQFTFRCEKCEKVLSCTFDLDSPLRSKHLIRLAVYEGYPVEIFLYCFVKEPATKKYSQHCLFWSSPLPSTPVVKRYPLEYWDIDQFKIRSYRPEILREMFYVTGRLLKWPRLICNWPHLPSEWKTKFFASKSTWLYYLEPRDFKCLLLSDYSKYPNCATNDGSIKEQSQSFQHQTTFKTNLKFQDQSKPQVFVQRKLSISENPNHAPMFKTLNFIPKSSKSCHSETESRKSAQIVQKNVPSGSTKQKVEKCKRVTRQKTSINCLQSNQSSGIKRQSVNRKNAAGSLNGKSSETKTTKSVRKNSSKSVSSNKKSKEPKKTKSTQKSRSSKAVSSSGKKPKETKKTKSTQKNRSTKAETLMATKSSTGRSKRTKNYSSQTDSAKKITQKKIAL